MSLAKLYRSAVRLQQLWDGQGFQFCFIGGIACQRWGEPHATKDLDLTLLTEFGEEAGVIDGILMQLQPRIADARQFALLNRVVLARDSAGTPIDIALGAMPFERRTVQRATDYVLTEAESIRTCSASDLIVHKAFAARERDWTDIRGILIRSRAAIDWQLILDELTPLVELKQEPEILDRLHDIYRSTA